MHSMDWSPCSILASTNNFLLKNYGNPKETCQTCNPKTPWKNVYCRWHSHQKQICSGGMFHWFILKFAVELLLMKLYQNLKLRLIVFFLLACSLYQLIIMVHVIYCLLAFWRLVVIFLWWTWLCYHVWQPGMTSTAAEKLHVWLLIIKVIQNMICMDDWFCSPRPKHQVRC